MTLIVNKSSSSTLRQRFIYLDCDFLGYIFADENVFTQVLNLLKESTIVIDSNTKFEFLRDTYDPKRQKLLEQFITQPMFFPALSHRTLNEGIENNALILSKIYAHHNRGKGVSTTDLMLAGRLMAQQECLLITGNKKDFPSYVFDSVYVLNFEDEKTIDPKTFWVIKFSKEKFDHCYKDIEKMESKYVKEIGEIKERV